MSRTRLILALTLTVNAASFASASTAKAFKSELNPWFNDPVTANIGETFLGATVSWFNRRTQECVNIPLDLDSDNYLIQGGNAVDIMIIVGGVGQGPIGVCEGVTMTALNYRGRIVDIFGGNGADVIFCGAGTSRCVGGTGNDVIRGYSAEGSISGDEGDDRMFGNSAITLEYIFGNNGDDCLSDPGNEHSLFDCGNHIAGDSYVFPATDAEFTCEAQVPSCDP